MKEGRFVCRAPQSFGEKAAVALFELLRPLRLVHVQRLSLIRFANIVKLEIGIGLDPHSAGTVGAQTRRRQKIAGKIDLEIAGLTASKVARDVKRIGIGVNPAIL